MKKLLVGVIMLMGASQAEAAFTPRAWVKGGINVVAGTVVAVDKGAEGLWDITHGNILHPLGQWGKDFLDSVASIGEAASVE